MLKALKLTDKEKSQFIIDLCSYDPSNQFAEVLEWWAAQTHVEHCSLYLYHLGSERLEHVRSLGLANSLIQFEPDGELGEGQIGLAARTRTLVQAPDLRHCPLHQAYLQEFVEHDVRSAYSVPLLFTDQLIGVIKVYRCEAMPLTAEQYTSAYASAQMAGATVLQIVQKRQHPVLRALDEYKNGIPRDKLSAPVRPEVLDSWDRCMKYFGKRVHSCPKGKSLPRRRTSDELLDIQENSKMLRRAARQHLTNLFKRVEEFDYAVLLADANGWIIDAFGNPRPLHKLQKDGIWLGTNISEKYIGNTAIGMALATHKSMYVHSYEHFFRDHQHWSSAAAPIFSELDSRLLGICTFFTISEQLDPFIYPLVQSASIAIANAVQLDELQQDATRVHQSLLSHLDYHIIQLNARNQVLNERHPIPVFEPVKQEMIRITQQGEYSHYEMSIRGRIYVVDVRDLWDAKGARKGRLGLFQDVTQSKQIDARLQDTERLSVLASLAAGIAHEIRNPLTTARGFLQLFAERLRSEQDQRFLRLTITELDRIHQLVVDFMSLAKPDEPHYAETDLTGLIENAVQFLHPEASLHGVILTMDVPASPIYVWADEKQMKQILMNIVQNALQACTTRDSVVVQLTPQAHQVELKVMDTGCGMTAEQLERVFQPFFTTKASGTGLGLSITKRIIEEHHGTVHVESTQGLGTAVRIVLNRLLP